MSSKKNKRIFNTSNLKCCLSCGCDTYHPSGICNACCSNSDYDEDREPVDKQGTLYDQVDRDIHTGWCFTDEDDQDIHDENNQPLWDKGD